VIVESVYAKENRYAPLKYSFIMHGEHKVLRIVVERFSHGFFLIMSPIAAISPPEFFLQRSNEVAIPIILTNSKLLMSRTILIEHHSI
jgi:hypothetical protein